MSSPSVKNLIRVAAEVRSSNRIEYPTSLPSSQPYSSATLTATVVAATRLGYIRLAWPNKKYIELMSRGLGVYLRNADNLAIRAPTAMFQKLGYLSGFSRARLTHDDGNWVGLYEIQ